MQVRRSLRRSLALAQSRMSCEIRMGHSKLHPVRSPKFPRMKAPQPLWETVPLVFHGGNLISLVKI